MRKVFDLGRVIEAGLSMIPSMRARDFLSYLQNMGFQLFRQNGDHAIYKHPDGRTVSVPMHREMAKGTLHRMITKDMGLSLRDFQQTYYGR